jgi:hypothetical protein
MLIVGTDIEKMVFRKTTVHLKNFSIRGSVDYFSTSNLLSGLLLSTARKKEVWTTGRWPP